MMLNDFPTLPFSLGICWPWLQNAIFPNRIPSLGPAKATCLSSLSIRPLKAKWPTGSVARSQLLRAASRLVATVGRDECRIPKFLVTLPVLRRFLVPSGYLT